MSGRRGAVAAVCVVAALGLAAVACAARGGRVPVDLNPQPEPPG